MTNKVPVQSLIDHIKTAIDVDPWAKEMAEDLLKEQEAVVRCKECKHGFRLDDTNYIVCGRPFASNRETHTEEWYCACGERKDT